MGFDSKMLSAMLENIVFLEMKRRGYLDVMVLWTKAPRGGFSFIEQNGETIKL